MRYTMLIAAASAAALISGAAFAQSATTSGSTMSQAPAAGDTAVNPPNPAVTSSASGSTDVTVAPAAGAPTERAPASDLSANTQIIASPPVPDTPQTRSMYRPLSNAGNHTAPAGN